MYTMLWFIILITLIVIEVATADALVTIWFIPAALISLIVTAFTDVSFMTQCILFFLISVLTFVLLKPQASKYLRGNRIATNADRVIGKHTKLIKNITESELGEVRINGVVWNATTLNNSSISKDTLVKIVAIDGSKLIVEKI